MKAPMGMRLIAASVALLAASPVLAQYDVDALEELGKRVFFEKISDPARQACATCHVPAEGWTSKFVGVNKRQVVVPGAVRHTAGNRKPPAVAYASFSPRFGDSALFADIFGPCGPFTPGLSCAGGLFWDGRADGNRIGAEVFGNDLTMRAAYQRFLGPAADQALSPFANDVEQNVPDGNDNGVPGAEAVCLRVKSEEYAELFEFAWGEPIDCGPTRVDISFKRIAVAISAWEHSSEVNSFSSRRDRALAKDNDDTPRAFPLQGLSNLENQGHDLFYGITSTRNPSGKNAQCAVCHNSKGLGSQGNEPDQLYTDETFHHLGLPPNHDIANFDVNDPDVGLAEFLDKDSPASTLRQGHFRTPTLRNVDKRSGPGFVKAYMHNGYFKSLEDVVHFYNTASLKEDPLACPPGTTAAQARARDCWPAAETPPHMGSARGTPFVGNLGLTVQEEAAIVAYLKTLSDTATVTKPEPYKKRRRPLTRRGLR